MFQSFLIDLDFEYVFPLAVDKEISVL